MLRPVAIRHYLATMRERGIAEERVLQSSGIDAARLGDPSYVVELDQCQIVVGNMLRLDGGGGLGFDVGLRTELTDLGIVGFAAMSCKTMHEALRLWVEYGNSLVGVMSRLELVAENAETVTLRVVEPEPTSELFVFCVEEIIAMMDKVGTLLAAERPEIRSLSLSFPAPHYAHRYHDLFDCPIRFGLAHTSFTVAQGWIRKPLRTSDEEHHSVCVQHCGQILRQIEGQHPITSRLRTLFLRRPSALPSLDEAARELALSPRSLRRHLQELGTSYQTLVGDFRADLAREYLRSTALSTKEIGYLLGFSDHSTFRRAFKNWTGVTTRQYRAGS